MLFLEFIIGSSWDKFIKSIKLSLLYADFFLCSAGNNRGPDTAPYETCAGTSNTLKQIIGIETQYLKKKNLQSHYEFSLGKQEKEEASPVWLCCPKPLVVGKPLTML